MLVGGERGPDLQAVPAVTSERQPHFLENPSGDAAHLPETSVSVLHFANEFDFRRLQRSSERGGEPAIESRFRFGACGQGRRASSSRLAGAKVAHDLGVMLRKQGAHGGILMMAIYRVRFRTGTIATPAERWIIIKL